jgi:hypothetical protein
MSSSSDNYENAKNDLLSRPGVTGITLQGNKITVYVEHSGVDVPSQSNGFTVEKKISGRVSIQK